MKTKDAQRKAKRYRQRIRKENERSKMRQIWEAECTASGMPRDVFALHKALGN